MRNKITNEQLLDCLTQGQELITAHGMNDLRSTLKNRGYGSQITPLDIEDVMKIAENLVEKNQDIDFEQIRHKGQPIKTPAQLSENDRTDTWSNIQVVFDTILKNIQQGSKRK
jgi:hypothetical protein